MSAFSRCCHRVVDMQGPAVLAVVALLALQAPAVPDLDEEYRRIRMIGTTSMFFTVIVLDEQGSPAKGSIWCDGYWWRHADEDTTVGGTKLTFSTDSRGAMIFITTRDAYDEEPWQTCHAESKGRVGSLTFQPFDRGVYRLIVH